MLTWFSIVGAFSSAGNPLLLSLSIRICEYGSKKALDIGKPGACAAAILLYMLDRYSIWLCSNRQVQQVSHL